MRRLKALLPHVGLNHSCTRSAAWSAVRGIIYLLLTLAGICPSTMAVSSNGSGESVDKGLGNGGESRRWSKENYRLWNWVEGLITTDFDRMYPATSSVYTSPDIFAISVSPTTRIGISAVEGWSRWSAKIGLHLHVLKCNINPCICITNPLLVKAFVNLCGTNDPIPAHEYFFPNNTPPPLMQTEFATLYHHNYPIEVVFL